MLDANAAVTLIRDVMKNHEHAMHEDFREALDHADQTIVHLHNELEAANLKIERLKHEKAELRSKMG